MAYQLVREVLDHAPPMTAAERLVLVAIAETIRSPNVRQCDLDTEALCRRTGGLDASKVRAALRRLAGRNIEVRVRRGVDRSGQPVYAWRGQVPRYQLPAFPAPRGCRCIACLNLDESAVDNFQEGGRSGPPSDKTAGQEGGRVGPPSPEGGRKTTEGGRSTTEGGRKTTTSVAERPPLPSMTEIVISQRAPTTTHLIDRTGATDEETQLLLKTIKTRYRPRSIAAYVRAMPDDDLAELLTEIRTAQPANPLPPKCDQCGPNRLIELPSGGVTRCPTCHPRAA